MNTDRFLMAELIAENGPMEGDAIRGALDWEFGRIRDVVRGEASSWFVLTATGWDLTELGRGELETARSERIEAS